MRFLIAACLLFVASLSLADGPRDNHPEDVRPVPPIGIELGEADRNHLEQGLKQLLSKLESLEKRTDPHTERYLTDVEIFARAIRDALAHRELFRPPHVTAAKKVLAEGLARADALADGDAPWAAQTGLVVRGFRSRIDDTVQPYGLVIPENYAFSGVQKHRLDLWLHGRGEVSSESVFINERMTRPGRFTPADTLVLHPYGRYSNAFKFAGEIDVLEALEHAKEHYQVDDRRVSIRGFSMGGAGCWQMAVHYPSLFFAANPGAGFSETPEFLKSFQQETLHPTWYEKKLWQMYDCPGYADNLLNLPTVAYSGELDIQKQAADVMERALKQRRMRLLHLIGPETKHTIDAGSMKIIEEKMASLARMGRDEMPQHIRFATYTLRYDKSHWVRILGLREHWSRGFISASIGPRNAITVTSHGVTEFEINIPSGHSPFDQRQSVNVIILEADERGNMVRGAKPQAVSIGETFSDRSLSARIHLSDGKWTLGRASINGISKRHGLQGPIDDAFMDRFIVVAPTGTSPHQKVQQWTQSEMSRLVREWRRQFRGDVIVKQDTDISQEDIDTSHLILFGDPHSNSVLKTLVNDLPIQWNDDHIAVGEKQFDSSVHAPVMIYPNPRNPNRYVVLNSGFTYREYAYLNNARQVPKLPDWAIINLDTPSNTLWPGEVVDANFFNETWQLK